MSAKFPPLLDPETDRRLQGQAPRTWQRMLSGRRLNLITPSPVDIEIEDIALSLSRNTRWNGQTIGPFGWSVAQHSLFVVEILRSIDPRPNARLLMTGLLHDASEYVTHDIITPLKAALGTAFLEIEDRLTCAIYTRFGLPTRPPPEVWTQVKKADAIAAATEAVQLAGFSEPELVSVLGIREKPLERVQLDPLAPREVSHQFLNVFKALEQGMRLMAGSGETPFEPRQTRLL